jgi:hypothetical protein
MNLLNIFLQVITIISIVAGIGSFIVGIVIYNRQMNAQVFLQYTQRYEEIMKSFPKNGWAARINSDDALPEPNDEISLCALRYLNLCSEEYYLYRDKYLSKKVWEMWEKEMIRTLQTPLFQREWMKLKDEFDAYPEFQAFVEDINHEDYEEHQDWMKKR